MTFTALLALSAIAPMRQVVLTIDDLCFVGKATDYATAEQNTRLLLKPIAANKIPAAGFVVGSTFDRYSRPQADSLYKLWVKAGCTLGNHTWTHANLDEVGLKAYEDEILRTDTQMRTALGVAKVKYFRAPYLNDGKDDATKQGLRDFLQGRKWTEAPVTIDTDDYKFATAYDEAFETHDDARMDRLAAAYVPYMEARTAFFEEQSRQLFGRDIPQIILTHANRINAKQMPELIRMFRRRGYQFVSLDQAMKDPAYRTPDTYVGSWGLSWIYRWQLGKGQKIAEGPKPPDWVVNRSNVDLKVDPVAQSDGH